MTRLQTKDICHIVSGMAEYNTRLIAATGKSVLEIACHACNTDSLKMKSVIDSFSIHVVKDTSGKGEIPGFCDAVCAILVFLGFNAVQPAQSDLSGVAHAYESGAHAFMMADDNRFAGINMKKCVVVDNTRATGQVFAAALDLMAGSVKDHHVLIMGAGSVGASAAERILSFGGSVILYDIHHGAALSLRHRLLKDHWPGTRIAVQKDLKTGLSKTGLIIEATPGYDTMADGLISENMIMAAPGVPLGISETGIRRLGSRLVHDRLELGVAAMAVSLVL